MSGELQSYRSAFARVGKTVTVRRYAGIGAARAVSAEADGLARVIGYQPDEIVGDIQQGDRKVILLNDPSAPVAGGKVALASLLPLTNSDKIVIAGREVAIMGPDDSTRDIGDELLALELQVRG
jgi:hypothetical protein